MTASICFLGFLSLGWTLSLRTQNSDCSLSVFRRSTCSLLSTVMWWFSDTERDSVSERVKGRHQAKLRARREGKEKAGVALTSWSAGMVTEQRSGSASGSPSGTIGRRCGPDPDSPPPPASLHFLSLCQWSHYLDLPRPPIWSSGQDMRSGASLSHSISFLSACWPVRLQSRSTQDPVMADWPPGCPLSPLSPRRQKGSHCARCVSRQWAS